MKLIITTLLLFGSCFAQAQQLNDDLKRALKADDSKALLTGVKANGSTINDCFEIEGASYTLLSLSIKMEKPEIFKTLVASKADLNKICSDKSPLMFAAKYGKLSMAKALIAAGAELKLASSEHKTALDYAVKYQQKDIEMYFSSLNTKQ